MPAPGHGRIDEGVVLLGDAADDGRGATGRDGGRGRRGWGQGRCSRNEDEEQEGGQRGHWVAAPTAVAIICEVPLRGDRGELTGRSEAAACLDVVLARDQREPGTDQGGPEGPLQRGRGARRVVAQQHAVQP